MNLPELTVVVTTFRRPERLKKCLQSLVDAGVGRVVVSGSACGAKEAEVCDAFEDKLRITRSFRNGDLGCNETWLRGVTLASTRYVLIMHDDDWLLPEFGHEYISNIYPQLERGAGFATWRGKVVSDINEIDDNVGCLVGETRVAGTASVTTTLRGPVTSPSPVISVFRRDISIRTLRECELSFTDSKHFTRPNMMVGNDLMLYLRHAEQFDSWFFLNKILTCHGGHDGSETAINQRTEAGIKKFVEKYDAAREYFSRVRVWQVPPTPKIFHVFTDYRAKESASKRRQDFARATWQPMFFYGNVVALPVPDGMFRTSKDTIGDDRPLPYLRDMLDYAASFALPEDVVMLTNDDTCFVPGADDKILAEFAAGANSAYAWRRNFLTPLRHQLKDIRTGIEDGGVDLIAFRTDIWLRHREMFPDFILGCEAWDYVYRLLIPELNGGRPGLHNLIYHEFHDPVWRQDQVRAINKGQKFNRALARNFFKRRSHSDAEIPRYDD
jgi:glycosyltransferase involved in cell wall biosynthesis